MIKVVPFAALGRFELDWLDSRFHFDFSGVGAPMGRGFGALRVWNDDLIRSNTGFDFHGHRDMEIVTYVRKGAISHQDSLGNSGRTEAGDVQVMHAGTGIMHAEWNRESEDTLIYQIWVTPDRAGHRPGWEQRPFPKDRRAGALLPLASGTDGVEGALKIHQDATLYGGWVKAGEPLVHKIRPGYRAYLVPAEGTLSVNGQTIEARGAAAIEGETTLDLRSSTGAEVLLMEVA